MKKKMILSNNFWLKLDNTAKIYPSITSARMSNIFRISATMRKPVNIKFLETAVKQSMHRYPYFRVNLKKGFFWYYLQSTNEYPRIYPEYRYPCRAIDITGGKSFFFRITAYQKRISIETSHALSDGFAILTFLKTIVTEYISLMHGPVNNYGTIPHPDKVVNENEFNDVFSEFNLKNIPAVPKKNKAFHLPFKRLPYNEYLIIRGTFSADFLKAIAKEKNISSNDLLVAILMYAFYQFYLSLPSKMQNKNRHPIRLVIPVDLRRIYKKNTMRNFTYFVDPHIDPGLGYYTFDEILKRIHHFIRLETTEKQMLPYIVRNVKAEFMPLLRIIPRPIKDLIFRIIFMSIGEKGTTSSLSNLGVVNLPPEIGCHVTAFEAIPARHLMAGTGCAVVTYNSTVYINFGRNTAEPFIEKLFFKKLTEMGIQVKIEANRR